MACVALTIVLKANERASENALLRAVLRNQHYIIRRSGIVTVHCPTTIRELLSVPNAFRAANPIPSKKIS